METWFKGRYNNPKLMRWCLFHLSPAYAFGKSDVLVPLKVLKEIDRHKKRQDSVGLNARMIIRTLDELRSKGSLKKGVRIDKGHGIVFARLHDLSLLPSELDKNDPDNTMYPSIPYSNYAYCLLN